MPGPQQPRGAAPSKLALRDQLVTARNRRTVAEIGAAGAGIAEHLLTTPEVRRAATVAAYVAVGPEPGTGLLLDALLDQGRRVLLPVLGPDQDLDWGVYRGAAGLVPGPFGILEPTAPRLGTDAVATADAVLVPGLAVSDSGLRIGRGGGSYDRALARVPTGTFTCVLVYEDEVGRDVPGEPHDQRVTAAATPAGITRFPRVRGET